jgi:hypothetical protein
MRLLKKGIIFIFICFLLCSCSVKNDSTLTINKDGSLKYNILIAFDKSLIQTLSKTNILKNDNDIYSYVNENIKDDYLNGFVKKEFNDNEYVGNEYTYEIDDLDSVSTTDDVKVSLKNSSLVEKNIFTKKNDIYIASFIYDLDSKYKYENVDFKNTFTVNLPVKALSSNADRVINDGKTLIWNINNGESKKIDFKFTFKDIRSYISLGFLILDVILTVVLIVLVIRRKVK